MISNVISTRPKDKITHIANLMEQHNVGSIPIVKNKKMRWDDNRA